MNDTGKICLTVIACAALLLGLFAVLSAHYTQRVVAAMENGYEESVNIGPPSGFWIKADSKWTAHQ